MRRLLLQFVLVLLAAGSVQAQVTVKGSTLFGGGAGGGGASSLATYSKIGSVAGGVCYVSPYVITSDAFAAFNSCLAQLPAAGGVIDATALGTSNYAVSTPLTALNNAAQAVALILNPGTSFTVNTSFASPTNSPASCAVPVGNNSAIIVPGAVPLNPNFRLGSSARVWDFMCNGNFTGSQQSMRLDGVELEGNSAASLSGALLHIQGIARLARIANSSTQACYGQCVELDAGSSPPQLARMLLDGDHWTDGVETGTYPGSIVKIDAVNSAGAIGNIVFEGGSIDFNGPHNPLLVINGRGSAQLDAITFLGTHFNTAAATASGSNPNVDPIQLIDVSEIYFSGLRQTGYTTPSSQPNLVDISQSAANLSYGISINQVDALTAAQFTCLINNTVEGTCETGFPTAGSGGDTTLPNYTYGQVIPQVRQTTYAPPSTPGQCSVGSIWTNSSGTNAANTAFVCEGNPGSQTYQPFGGGGGGGGNVDSGTAYQLGQYPATGTTIGPTPALYALTSAMTQAQINTLFSSLQSSGGTVVIPDGVAQQSWTNTAAQVKDWRKGADWLQISRYGISCDAGFLYVSLTSGSNQVNVGSSLTASAIGKYMVFGYRSGLGYGATQASWTAQITGYTFPNATLSANAPFNFTGWATTGTDNSTNLQIALNDAGTLYPLSIPSGCSMLTLKPLQWNAAQSLAGRQMSQSGFYGGPAQDILQQPDASGAGTASAPGVTLKNLTFAIDSSVDASLGYTSYNAAGVATTVPPLYRPLGDHTPAANNPCAIGWFQGCSNGVASTTQNSAVICYSTAAGQKTPAVGNTIVFPYFAGGVFTSTVSSLSGAGCSGATAAATLAGALPNTSGYTTAQSEWFAGTSAQTTTVALPVAMTYPFTLTLANSIAPDPSAESNVASHGHIKILGNEFDYLGLSYSPPYSIVLRKGPATLTSCNGSGATCVTSGATVVPLNPCAAKNLFGSTSDQPWPVTPTLNSGDSTPSGANWFPAWCGGNAAISFPEANGNVYVTTGLTNSFVENVQIIPIAGQNLNTNSTMGMYFAGNLNPYGVDFGGINTNGVEYSIAQGPASAGQHGVAAVGPTGTGNTWHDLSLHTAYPLIFADMQQSDVNRVDSYSTEISPYDGSTIGPGTCVVFGYTLDEQSGAGVTATAQDSLRNHGCEPEGGNHQEIGPYAVLDGFSMQFSQDNFEAGPTYVGGSQEKFENGQLALPAFNYGSNNDFQDLAGPTAAYITNTWNSAINQFYNWGQKSTCSNYVGGIPGPLTNCGAGFAQGYSGHSMDSSKEGTVLGGHGEENALGGQIVPGEWNTNPSLGGTMSVGFTIDPTEPYWGSYAACNFSPSASCSPDAFNGFDGYMFIGSHNRIVDGSYVLVADLKTVAAGSSFTMHISALDAGTGQCGTTGDVAAPSITTTTSWAPVVIGPFSFAGRAGCILSVTFGPASTTDQLRVGFFNFVPVPQWQLLQVATYTSGASCAPNGALLGSDSTNLYMCVAGTVKLLPFGGGGGGGGSFSALTSGTNSAAAMLVGGTATLGTTGGGTIAATTATTATTAGGPTGTPTLCGSGQGARGVGASFAAQGCTTFLQGSLTALSIPVASGPSTVVNSLLQDSGNTLTYTGSGGMQIIATTPGKIAMLAGTGSIPALPNNSAGFAAPTSGGTPYLLKLPNTITQGFLLAGAPGTGDGVNESAVTTQHLEFPISTGTGQWGQFGTTSPVPLASYTAANAGHVITLTAVYAGGATCAIGPTVGIYDNTTLGFAVTGAIASQPVGTVTVSSGSMSFGRGDVLTLAVEGTTGNCPGYYNVIATVEEP
jgi:hypothetical protein